MRKQFLAMSLSALLLSGVGFAAIPTASAATSDFDCTYSASAKGDGYSLWGATNVLTYTAEEAAAAGVPAGYENEVIKIASSQSSMGVLVNYSAKKVPTGLVENLVLRIYLEASSGNTGKYPEVRIPDPMGIGDTWVHCKEVATPTGEWTTVTIPATKFANISQGGYLNQFEIGVRSNANIDFYIDSIALDLKENDGVAPVITSAEGTSITWYEGAEFTMEATAFDAQENRNVEVTKTFGADTQFAADGTLKAGEWSLTLSAKDYYGNESTKTYLVTVLQPDVTPPVITTNVETMYAKVGTIPMLKPMATDDSGNVTVTASWSEGALDAKGRLTKGTHTYTIVAVDPSQNTATHTITVIVADDNGLGDDFIDEEVQEQEMLEQQLNAAKDAAVLQLAEALAAYQESDYSAENYGVITAAHTAAKEAILAETDKAKLDGHVAQFVTAADKVLTIQKEAENALKAARELALTDLEEAYAAYQESDYSAENYGVITAAYVSAMEAICVETDLEKMDSYVAQFVAAADEVKPIEKNPEQPETPDKPTDQPEDETPGGETNPPAVEKGGCGGTAAAATVAVLLCGAMVALKKKKE